MSVQAGMTDAELTVVLDIRYPQAFLALQPAMNFSKEHGVLVDWLPHSVSSLKAPEQPGVEEDRGVRHRRFRAEQIAREIEVYAEAQGLVLRDLYRAWDSSAFELGWLWMRHHHRQQLEDFLCEAFRAYWAIEFDPTNASEVAILIDSLVVVGGDRAGGRLGGELFRAWAQSEGVAVLEGLAEALRAEGVFGVPSYLVEGEVFLGRQHLPMIEWILSGRRGRVPI